MPSSSGHVSAAIESIDITTPAASKMEREAIERPDNLGILIRQGIIAPEALAEKGSDLVG
jgi:hypothetical protein